MRLLSIGLLMKHGMKVTLLLFSWLLAPLISLGQVSENIDILEEVIVYGSKLDETPVEVTDSVARVSGDRLDQKQLRSAGDVFRLLGNVRAPQFSDGGFVIRGINSQSPDAENISGQQAPLSSIFVDGVALTQQASFRGPQGLWDVESLEVFRGPQSTLQGKNSLAGAVVLKTKDPEFTRGGSLRTTYGEYNQKEVALMLNAPLSDEWAVRFTYENRERDSFVDAPNLRQFQRYEDFNTSTSRQFRAKLLFEPATIPLRSLFTYSYSDISPTNNDVFGPSGPRIQAGPGVSVTSVDSFFDRRWLSNFPNQQVRETGTHTFAWENKYELSDTLKITSLTTYIDTALDIGTIGGGFVRDENQSDLTQEIRLNWDDSWGKSVLGIYGSLQEADSTLSTDSRRANAALFGQVDYGLTDSLYLIAGGRLNYDDFEFKTNQRPDGISTEDARFLPKIGGRYEFSDTHTLGFVFQQGFQSGGTGVQLNGDTFVFDPSLTNNFEIPWRQSFFGERLKVSANAFYTDWKDQQVVVRELDNTFQIDERVINAADSSLYGSELELEYEHSDSLRFFGSVGLLVTRYDNFSFQVPPVQKLPTELDFSGYDFPESPNFTFSFGASYRHDSGFFLNADLAYAGSSFSPVLFAPLASGLPGSSIQVPQDNSVEVDSSFTVNLTMGYEAEDWNIAVFAQNLFGNDSIVGQVPQAVNGVNGIEFQDGFFATVTPPQFFGMSLEYSF